MPQFSFCLDHSSKMNSEYEKWLSSNLIVKLSLRLECFNVQYQKTNFVQNSSYSGQKRILLITSNKFFEHAKF